MGFRHFSTPLGDRTRGDHKSFGSAFLAGLREIHSRSVLAQLLERLARITTSCLAKLSGGPVRRCKRAADPDWARTRLDKRLQRRDRHCLLCCLSQRAAANRIPAQSHPYLVYLYPDFHPAPALGIGNRFFPAPLAGWRFRLQHIGLAMGCRVADSSQNLSSTAREH